MPISRLLERRQIFLDCIHLLALHEPGNELHVVPEFAIPGGSVDFVLTSVRDGKVRDFTGIEIQTLDSTGTVWPERQRFLRTIGIPVDQRDTASTKPFGMNWKMTGKTTLIQLHHKAQTFEGLSKYLVLALQGYLLEYMSREFSFGHLTNPALTGDSIQFHAYSLIDHGSHWRLELASRLSTDAAGIAVALGLQVSPTMQLNIILKNLEARISSRTLLSV